MVERFLYILSAMSALGPLRAGNTTEEELKEDLIRIWDEQKFTPADAADFANMADRLRPLLTTYVVNESYFWLPVPPSRRKRR